MLQGALAGIVFVRPSVTWEGVMLQIAHLGGVVVLMAWGFREPRME